MVNVLCLQCIPQDHHCHHLYHHHYPWKTFLPACIGPSSFDENDFHYDPSCALQPSFDEDEKTRILIVTVIERRWNYKSVPLIYIVNWGIWSQKVEIISTLFNLDVTMLSLYVGGSQVGLRLRLETVAFSHARALCLTHVLDQAPPVHLDSWPSHSLLSLLPFHNHFISVILTTFVEGFKLGTYILSYSKLKICE